MRLSETLIMFHDTVMFHLDVSESFSFYVATKSRLARIVFKDYLQTSCHESDFEHRN